MLEYLHITNLAIIEDVELELGPGLCVITGETGAGKSILVGAIAALRGARVGRDAVRDGADRAVVEAVLRADGAPEPLTLSRVLAATGRSRQRLDGELASVSELAKRVAPLVDISGQHDGQGLTDAAMHRVLLDASGVSEPARRELREAVARLDEVSAQLRQLSLDDREREARLDLLRYQRTELEAARPEEGEDEQLEHERRRLASAADLERIGRGAHALVYEEEGAAAERIGRAVRLLGEGATLDPDLAEPLQRLEEAQVLVDDVARDLLDYADGIEGDPARLEQVEDRLAELRRLCRKHGETVAGLVALQARLADEVETLQDADARLSDLRKALQAARERTRLAAEKLTRARKRAGTALRKAVEGNLARLGMPEARFEVRLTPREARRGDEPDRVFEGRRVNEHGWDRVEFFIAPNPGEDALPLAKTASGGELSRIMLALKLVLADRDEVVTYVFDEVDAGIGGATADAVGLALAEVARHRQVVCITHLPAIAAFADQHFRVTKRQEGGRTLAELSELPPKDRVEEVARMLGGARVTKKSRSAAAELIQRARSRVAGT